MPSAWLQVKGPSYRPPALTVALPWCHCDFYCILRRGDRGPERQSLSHKVPEGNDEWAGVSFEPHFFHSNICTMGYSFTRRVLCSKSPTKCFSA